MKKELFLSVVASSVILMIGCGGSSKKDLMQGQFIDSPVEGIEYKTKSVAGITNKNGAFYFKKSDETILFKVGNMKVSEFNLSTIKEDKLVLISDLLGLERNNTTDEKLIKIIQFLQSLDEDNNVSNGIEISENSRNKINSLIENNSSINSNLLDNNITTLRWIIQQIPKKWITENKARENYKKTLEILGYKPEIMPFITLWRNEGNDTTININVNTDIYEYNYSIDWGDGNISKDLNDSIEHTYAKEGNYTIKIIGKFPYFKVDGNGENNNLQIIEVKKWGDIKWESFERTFENCTNLKIIATDVPDLSNVKSLRSMFRGVNSNIFNNINEWDVSKVKNIAYMFSFSNFNQNINDWNVSNVLDMSGTFREAKKFNQPLNKWNVSNVKNMYTMFYLAEDFNQNINDWNVSNVTNMRAMFYRAIHFNQPLNDWDVSKVTTMYSMFNNAIDFNQSLDKWDVSNVTDMCCMFYNARSFDQNISMWDVSNVTNHEHFDDFSPIEGTEKEPRFP